MIHDQELIYLHLSSNDISSHENLIPKLVKILDVKQIL